jgi:DnaJ-class molecular chaperone
MTRPEGECLMDAMDCLNCDGTGYTEDTTGEEILCPMCDGAGILVTSHDATDDDRLP